MRIAPLVTLCGLAANTLAAHPVNDPALGLVHLGAAPPENLRSIAVPGSDARVVLWTENGAPRYALSRDGRTVDSVVETSYSLLLRYAGFDPLAGEPKLPAFLSAEKGSKARIVQFITQPLDEYRALLGAAGARVGPFLGHHAYIVRMSDESADAVSSLPVVRWVGALHPAYKLEEWIIEGLLSGGLPGAQRYSILMLPDFDATLNPDGEALAARLRDLGAQVHLVPTIGGRLEATLTPSQLLAAARMDDVLFIDRWFPPQSYMDNVRIVGGADYVRTFGYTGQGVRGEVMDSGLLVSHADFQRNPPIIHTANGSSLSHGTSVFGIVFGTGTANPQGLGMLPDAQGIFSAFSALTNRPAHIARLIQAPYFAVFQTNSWGSCCSTAYTTQAADMDNTIFNSDIVLLQAQANSGNSSSDVIAFAKNIVSVGGIRHFNTLTLADDAHNGNSGSTGPASDGRIKPDLSFWYDNIFTTSSASTTSYTATFGGTSAATPMTAGHFGIFFQMWSDGIFGNPVTPGATVFQNRPRSATSKAVMVNTARPYPFVGQSADLRRVRQGWGLADLQRLYDNRSRFFIIDGTVALRNLESRSWSFKVPPATPELRATMAYKDLPGVPNSSRHRINDLSLRVVAPDGTTFWGNNGLLEGNSSSPGGVANLIDTVENVWISNPAPGRWRFEVIASEIVQDARPDIPGVNADFALIVRGIACRADYNADNVADFFDYLDFIADFDAGHPDADFNRDGQIDFFDYLDFIAAYARAC